EQPPPVEALRPPASSVPPPGDHGEGEEAMKIEQVKSFADLEGFLREFTNFHGEPALYDFNGAFHLFLAILDNLACNHLDVDVEEHEELRPWFTEEQRRFLKKLDRLS